MPASIIRTRSMEKLAMQEEEATLLEAAKFNPVRRKKVVASFPARSSASTGTWSSSKKVWASCKVT
jgi:hypothetical protein